MALTDNLYLYFPLDTDGVDTVSNTSVGGTDISYVTGKLSKAASFNGTTSRFQTSTSGAGWTRDNDVTLAAWFKTTSTAAQYIITTNYTGNDGNIFLQSRTDGKIELSQYFTGGTDGYTITSPLAYNDGNWHYIVGTSDVSRNWKLYVDGAVVVTGTAIGIKGYGGQFNIGNTGFLPATTFIDTPAMWSRALSAAEVTALYNGGTGIELYGLTTGAVSSISLTTAVGNGEIMNGGGATITERGFVWATTTAPTTFNSKVTTIGTLGIYTANLTSLVQNTLYYVRAYYINALGTTYGNEVTFTTLGINSYQLQYSNLNATSGETFVGQITVTGTVGTITVQLGTTGTSTVIAAGAGATTFTGTYSGLAGLIITRSATFDGTIDNVYYTRVPLGTTINWALNTVTLVTAIPSEVFFKRVEDEVFNSFRFYRHLELLFKDLDGYVTVTIRQEREDNTTTKTKTFSVGNTNLGTVSPFNKKRISFLCKDQAIIVGLSNKNLNETFSIAKFLLDGFKEKQKMFSPSKIVSL